MKRRKVFILIATIIVATLFVVGCPTEVEPDIKAVSSVSLDSNELFLEMGKTVTLVATVLPSNATNKAVSWASSSKSIAEVNNNGVVTAKELGETTITVTTEDGNFSATCIITVIEPIDENADVSAEDFSVMTLSGVIGYNVGFFLEAAKASDVATIVVKLYDSGNNVLATNTTTGLLEEYPNNTSLSAPFDVLGEFDYETDGCWNYSGWGGDTSDIPSRAKITVTFKNSVKKIVENDNLTGDTLIFTAKVVNSNQLTTYDTIQEAITEAESGDTIILGSDFELEETLEIDKTITLNLNGKTLSTPDATEVAAKTVLEITGTSDVTIKGGGLIQSGTTIKCGSNIDDSPTILINSETSRLIIKDGAVIKGGDAINSYSSAPAIWAWKFDGLNISNANIYGGNNIKRSSIDGGYENNGTAGSAVFISLTSGKTVNITGSTIKGGDGINDGYIGFEQGEGYKQASGGNAFSIYQTNTINITDSTIRGGDSDLLHGGHAITLGSGIYKIINSVLIGGDGNTADNYSPGDAINGSSSGSGSLEIDGLSVTIDGGSSNP